MSHSVVQADPELYDPPASVSSVQNYKHEPAPTTLYTSCFLGVFLVFRYMYSVSQ